MDKAITATQRSQCGCPTCMMELSQIVFGHLVEAHGGYVEVPLATLDAHLADGAAFMSAEVKTAEKVVLVRVYSTEEAVKEMSRTLHRG